MPISPIISKAHFNPDYAIEQRELLSSFAYKVVMNPNSQHLQVRFRGFIPSLSIKTLQHFITAYRIIRVEGLEGLYFALTVLEILID